jgi:hypothetical protein
LGKIKLLLYIGGKKTNIIRENISSEPKNWQKAFAK